MKPPAEHHLPCARPGSSWALACLALLLWGLPSDVQADSGSDDSFGYTWADSDSDGPIYDYEDLTVIAFVPMGDEAVETVPIGFTFVFYGENYTQIDLHSNGALSFGAETFISYQHSCPVAAPEQPTIAPYWTDLDPTAANAGGGVYVDTQGSAPNRRLIVEWFKVPHFSTNGPATFEVKLFEADGSIEFHYKDLNVDGDDQDYGRDAAIFISDGKSVLEIACDTESFHDEQFNQGAGDTLGFTHPPCDDLDVDGFCAWEDCNNQDDAINPSAEEECDKVDNDCDGEIDESSASDAMLWYLDNDGDGFGSAGVTVPATSCNPPVGYANNNIDCDDNDRNVFPGAHESCDDLDNDCDGLVDNPPDGDGDGATICDGDCDDTDDTRENLDLDGDGQSTCGGDCDDHDHRVETGSAEECDGVDNDCDDEIDENNCEGDVPPGHEIPYGCIMDCSVARNSVPAKPDWLLVLLPLVMGLRRNRRSPTSPKGHSQ